MFESIINSFLIWILFLFFSIIPIGSRTFYRTVNFVSIDKNIYSFDDKVQLKIAYKTMVTLSVFDQIKTLLIDTKEKQAKSEYDLTIQGEISRV